MVQQDTIDNALRRARAQARELNLAGTRYYERLSLEALDVLADYEDSNFSSNPGLVRKMMQDPAISSSVGLIKSWVVGEGVKAGVPAEFKRDEAVVRIARNIRADFRKVGINQILWSMLDALIYGNTITELTWAVQPDPVLGVALRLTGMFPRKPEEYEFVVSSRGPVIGVQSPLRQAVYDGADRPANPKELVLINRVVHLCPFMIGSDPRGASILSPAWNAWLLKKQLEPSFFRALNQFGSPSLIGRLPMEMSGQTKTDEDGRDATEVMLDTLAEFGSGSALVLPDGQEVEVIKPESAESLVDGMSALDRQIIMAILLSSRTILEAKSYSKADAEQAGDVTDALVQYVRRTLEAALQGVINKIVDWSITDGSDQGMAPTASLHSVRVRDFPGAMMAISQGYSSGFAADPSVVPHLDGVLGIEGRDYARMEERMEEAHQSMVDGAKESTRLRAQVVESEPE